MKNKYVLNRRFEAVGYFSLYHFIFWIALVINLAAYFGKGTGSKEIQGMTGLIFFLIACFSFNFSFKKLNHFIIDSKQGISATFVNILFLKTDISFAIVDIEKVEFVQTWLTKRISISLKSGGTYLFILESYSSNGEYGPSGIFSDFSIENEEMVEVARSLGIRHEESISKIMIKMINSHKKDSGNNLI